MSSKILNLLIRIIGLVITIILLVQPWLIRFNFRDPFVISGWTIVFTSIIAISVSSLLLAFYRPTKGYNSLTPVLLILFVAIGISLYYTNYNACLRLSMIGLGFLICLGSLRLFRKSIDNYSIAVTIAISGCFMAIYSIFQYYGCDFLLYLGSMTVVGTLSNPNYLGLFLCLTSSITFGLIFEFYKKKLIDSLVFLILFIIQISAIILLKKDGHMLCLAFMTLIWFWSNTFKYSGRISKKSPIIVGLLLAAILLGLQWTVYYETTKYPWKKITKVPYTSQPFVSRLILWQMGFGIFKEHPFTGTGVGSVPYIMPLKRPPTASSLGIMPYNKDPHSLVISLVAETGILGLWGFCSLLIAVYGCFIRKNSKYEPVDELLEWDNVKKIADEEKTDTEKTENIVKTDNKDTDNKDTENAENAENAENTDNTDNSDNENTISEERIFIFPWLPLLIIILIAFLSISAGFIPKEFTAVVIALILIAFGLTTSLINYDYKASKNDYYFVSKSTLTAIFTFVFYGLFNGTILPLAGFIVLLISLHFSCCLPEVRFKPRFTGVSFLFIFLPVIYTFAACMFEMSYYKEQKNITNGIFYAKAGKYDMAEQCFKTAININPQSLESYSGLAQTLEAQEKLDEAQDIFEQLDAMVPNIYRSKYNIANILFKKGKILEAHRIAVKNLEWAEDAVSYELLGLILLTEGRQNEAEETFKEGLISVPLNYEEILAADRLRLNLSYLAIRKGDYNKCKTYLDSIRSGISEEIDYQYLKGVISVKEKKYNEALEIYEKLLKLYPNVPRILNATGYVLTLMNKDLDRAQLLIETAYEVMSKDEKANNLEDYLDITNSLGKLYLKQNKLKRAGELLKIAYEETPDELKELKAERLKDLNDFYNSFGKAE